MLAKFGPAIDLKDCKGEAAYITVSLPFDVKSSATTPYATEKDLKYDLSSIRLWSN